MGSGAEATLFAPPDVVAELAVDGCLLLRSADPPGGHPVTMIRSLRARGCEGDRPGGDRGASRPHRRALHWRAAAGRRGTHPAGRRTTAAGELITAEVLLKTLAQALAGHNQCQDCTDRAARGGGPPAGPGRRRDHRQGLCQPAERAGPPGGPCRPALQRPRASRRRARQQEHMMRGGECRDPSRAGLELTVRPVAGLARGDVQLDRRVHRRRRKRHRCSIRHPRRRLNQALADTVAS